MKKILYCVTAFIILAVKVSAQEGIADFDSDKWNLSAARKTEFLGRKAIMGKAFLKDAQLENGVIEVDLAVTGARSYPGILWRIKDNNEYERFYIRPHLSKTFQNVLQYVSSFNGTDSWQLYFGPGKTASWNVPVNQWFHVKIEVMGTQARIFLNNSTTPNLFITDLSHGISNGSLGLDSPMDGSAYFSNFSYRIDNSLQFPPAEKTEIPIGMIKNWEISQKFNPLKIEFLSYPNQKTLKQIVWKKIESNDNGLVDISHYYPRSAQAPDLIYARTIINSEKDQVKQFVFGYSDIITISLNGRVLFNGNSSYTSRDPNFQGIVGLNDYIYLPLKKGKNELLISIYETFGGWGFMFQDGYAEYRDKSLAKLWETQKDLGVPESVVYDKKRNVIYASNYFNEGKEFISKLKPNGEIIKLEWITGIYGPTGICIYNDKLYVVGRYNLIEIDIETEKITNRFAYPAPQYANDVACDDAGNFYVSDSQKNVIYKLTSGKFEEWVKDSKIIQPNGLLVDGDKLLVGCTGDASIKVVNTKDKSISTLCSLERGSIMDGLAKDGKGNYLISDNNGRIFRVTKQGEKSLLLNMKVPGYKCADFEFIPDKKLLIIPTFDDNRIMAFRLD